MLLIKRVPLIPYLLVVVSFCLLSCTGICFVLNICLFESIQQFSIFGKIWGTKSPKYTILSTSLNWFLVNAIFLLSIYEEYNKI